MARLRPDGEIEETPLPTRRLALGTIGVGFALAARPVAASTIITDSTGILVADVRFPVSDGMSPAYVARPKAGGPHPAILLVSEIFGLHEHIRDLARRLAKAGYAVIAPDYFYRAGDPSKLSSIDEIRPIVMKETLALQLSDSDSAIAWLGKQAYADTKRLGITGFCWGGGVTWMMATHSPPVRACVAWYGGLKRPASATDNRPYPLDMIGAIKAPVLGLYGALDKGILVADVEAMQAELKAAKKDCEIIIYPDADHGFNADYRPSYNEADAKDGWARMLDWFKTHGVA
jgi:carboxymethylenebutenolidase